jgi:hypothetical protein
MNLYKLWTSGNQLYITSMLTGNADIQTATCMQLLFFVSITCVTTRMLSGRHNGSEPDLTQQYSACKRHNNLGVRLRCCMLRNWQRNVTAHMFDAHGK